MTVTMSAGRMVREAKYAALGAIAFDNLALLDGLNEEGLAVGAFSFSGFAEYTDTTP